MTISGKGTVLVTGATGFIAQHVIDKLLSRRYSVIGTVRSQSKCMSLLKEFIKKYPNCNLSFEIVSDISVDNAFDEVLSKHSEIDYIIHTASPFFYGSKKPLEEVFLNPAVNGTMNILRGIKKHLPNLKNLVITSSFAAIKQMDNTYTTYIHTDKTWNPIKWEDVKSENDAYIASKTYAEKAARKFYQENDFKFNFSTVNPPYVFGPQVFDCFVGKVLNTSNEILNDVSKIGKHEETPQVMFGALAIDVRDVAEFHILPLENQMLQNQRQLIVSEPVTAQRVLNIMNQAIPQFKDNIAKGDPKQTNILIQNFCPKYDISNLLQLTENYQFISLEKSICDVYDQYFRVNTAS